MQYDDEIFKNNILYLRETIGKTGKLSQEEFGELIHVSGHTVSNYEKGTNRNPSLKTLKRIAEIADVSIEDLLTVEFAKEGDFNFGSRKPRGDKAEYKRFEGKKYYAYFLSTVRSPQHVYTGTIQFDEKYNEAHRLLNGDAEIKTDSDRKYDCKLVIEDHHTFYIYGIGKDIERRFYICMYYPGFTKNDRTYDAGLGVLVRINDEKSITALKVAVTDHELDLDSCRDDLIACLTEDKITVTRTMDGKFREWAAIQSK